MIRSKFATMSIALGLLGISAVAQADPMVFDRGLPTTNLNNDAGANRSNVGWGFGEGYFAGDDFTLGGSGLIGVTKIRTWVTAGSDPNVSFGSLYGGLSLWLSPAGGANSLTVASTAFNASLVTYAGGASYQGTSGSMINLWQIDWDFASLNLTAGTKYNFGVSGTEVGSSNSKTVFLHSSNASQSGSPQEGADNLLSGWDATGGDYFSWTSQAPNVWDKTSDANIQVFGSQPVPEPFTMIFSAAGLGVALYKRRSAKKSA